MRNTILRGELEAGLRVYACRPVRVSGLGFRAAAGSWVVRSVVISRVTINIAG